MTDQYWISERPDGTRGLALIRDGGVVKLRPGPQHEALKAGYYDADLKYLGPKPPPVTTETDP